MSVPSPLRVGVAGVGYLGQHHARLYAELPGVTLAGVYDTNPARAAEIAGKFNCPVFASVADLGRTCDAVSVVVPTDRVLVWPYYDRHRGGFCLLYTSRCV